MLVLQAKLPSLLGPDSEKNGAAKHAIDELEPDLTKPDGIYKILMSIGLEMCIGRVS